MTNSPHLFAFFVLLAYIPCVAIFTLAGICIWKDNYIMGILFAFFGMMVIPHINFHNK